MKIVKLGYSHNPWRLVTDDGREMCTDLRNDSGEVIASGHPVCAATKSEIVDWALNRLQWYIQHARMGLVPVVHFPESRDYVEAA